MTLSISLFFRSRLFVFLILLFFIGNLCASPFQEIIPQEEDREIVEVVSTGMNFELPKEISSGWTTFQYKNLSPDVHFFVFEKMPEGKGIQDSRSEIIPVFTRAMDLINTGNPDQGFAEFNNLPTWFFDVVFTGGPGLISPSKTAQTTVNLEPGTYVIECYVKMPNGMFHSAMGMIEEIEVLPANNNRKEPSTRDTITISAEEGIKYEGTILPGKQTFAVNFKDQKAHEHFIGHDVHLVRLLDGNSLQELNDWMNWADPAAFKTPAPRGVEFLGGTQEMPAGKISYFTATLEPGEYALISEVPDPLGKNMLKTFTVPHTGKSSR